MLKWRIYSKREGRYVRFSEDEEGKCIFLTQKESSTVFTGTRDFVDGVCFGLTHYMDDVFEAESIIHVQKPAHHAKMDADNEGK